MVSKGEIESDIQWVNEFRNNSARAMGLRMQIVQNRIKAIQLLKQDLQSKGGLALLKRTVKNERWFDRIIENGLAKSFDKLKEIYAWMRQNVRDKEAKNNVKRLIQLIQYFNSKSKDIDKRLQLEEAFLKSQDKNSFNRFLNEWKKDFKIRKKIINKIAGAGTLTRYFKEKKGYLDALAIHGPRGTALGIGYVLLNKFFFKEPTGLEIAEIIGAFTFAWIVMDIIFSLIELEKRIYMDEFVELEEAVRASRGQAPRY